MNEFDQRWQTCAARARGSVERETGISPGFVGRVLAQVGCEPEFSSASLWLKYAWRGLTGAAAVLVTCTALEFFAGSESNFLLPPFEDAVTQVFWLL